MPSITVSHRLLLLAAIPIAALTWIAGQEWARARAEVLLCDELTTHSATITAVSELVQALQRERGMSAVTLNGGVVDLAGQRRKGDAILAALPADPFRQRCAEAIASLRAQVQANQGVGEVIGGFTRLIDKVLTHEAEVAKEHDEFGIGRLYGSLLILEQGKEQVGRLRARLSAAAAADKPITLGEVKAIAAALAGGESSLTAKALDLPPATGGSITALRQGQAWKDLNAAADAVITGSQKGGYGLDHKWIFDTASVVIDSMHKVVQAANANAGERVASARQAARDRLGERLLTMGGLVGGIVLLAVVLGLGIIRPLRRSVGAVGASAASLGNEARSLLDNAGRSERESQGMSAAAEQLSNGMSTMAAAAEQMASNVTGIGAAAEQITATVAGLAAAAEQMATTGGDIAGRARKGSELAAKARQDADGAATAMAALATAAQAIGATNAAIRKVAEQTNLLALNAAIEAAKAGEAGRSFVVVAGNVKELAASAMRSADQVATAVSEVQAKVDEARSTVAGMQQGVHGISDAITDIGSAAEQIASTTRSVAEGVQQSDAGLKDIARSLGEIRGGSQDVARNAADSAQAVRQVAEAAKAVKSMAGQANATARQVETSVGELEQVAAGLRRLAG